MVNCCKMDTPTSKCGKSNEATVMTNEIRECLLKPASVWWRFPCKFISAGGQTKLYSLVATSRKAVNKPFAVHDPGPDDRLYRRLCIDQRGALIRILEPNYVTISRGTCVRGEQRALLEGSLFVARNMSHIFLVRIPF